MKAKLVKRTGEQRELFLSFSWGYFLFGPFYYLFNGFIGRFIVLSLIYVYGIWKEAGVKLVELLMSFGIDEKYISFLKFSSEKYYVTLGIVIGIHLVLSFISSKVVAKVLLRKKGYVPYSEIDAQLLIKHSLAKVGTMSFLSNYKPIHGVQGKIKIENTEELNKKLEELAELLKTGMITKDEYNTKRAEVLMNIASKK